MHRSRAPVIKYLRLPSGRAPAKFWEDNQLGLEHGIKTFSAYPEKNLLAVLEERFDDALWVTLVPTVLHVVGFSDLLNVCVPQRTTCQVAYQAIRFNSGYRSAS